MAKRKLFLILTLSLAALLLGACSGSRFQTTSWPGVTYDPETEQIYVAYNQQVYALDTAGEEQWRFPAEANARATYYAAPVIAGDGSILVGGYDNILYKVDEDNGIGEPLFSDAGNRYIASPLVADERIYATNANHELYALSLSGEESWEFETDQSIWASPVVDGSTIYVATLAGNLYALDKSNHTENWDQPVNFGGAIVNAPVIDADGTLYVGSFGNTVSAVSPAGNVRWQFPTEAWVWATPLLVDGTLYVGDQSGMMYAIDTATGSEVWSADLKSTILSTPVLFEDALYIGTENGEVFTVNPADGTSKKIQNVDGKLFSNPVVANDLLIFGVLSEESDVILVALETSGFEQWSFAPEK
jgi:eukaryotic-like serine/threonine-protein kinase